VSVAAQARRLDLENKRDRLPGGRAGKNGGNVMKEIIQAQSGIYGRVQVTLLLPVKEEILSMAKQMGINKAAFLRIALMIGASQLTKQMLLDNSLNIGNKSCRGSLPPTREEDGQLPGQR